MDRQPVRNISSYGPVFAKPLPVPTEIATDNPATESDSRHHYIMQGVRREPSASDTDNDMRSFAHRPAPPGIDDIQSGSTRYFVHGKCERLARVAKALIFENFTNCFWNSQYPIGQEINQSRSGRLRHPLQNSESSGSGYAPQCIS